MKFLKNLFITILIVMTGAEISGWIFVQQFGGAALGLYGMSMIFGAPLLMAGYLTHLENKYDK